MATRVLLVTVLVGLSAGSDIACAMTFIPANNADIQYYGRWDFSDPLSPGHSWPGVFVAASFNGTTIGVRMRDTVNYYGVYIDGTLHGIFHGTEPGDAEYMLAEGLADTIHTLRFSQRNISFGVYKFGGLIVDDGAKLFPLPDPPARKIEFIGDSFTAAEGNEAEQLTMNWEDKFPVTNADNGFAAMTARHFNAQYHLTARSGIGAVCDWQGDSGISMLNYFDRTLMEAKKPKWEFGMWIPDLVVVCLGLNDRSGLAGRDGEVSDKNSEVFREGYAKLLGMIRSAYPGVPILAWAPYPAWARRNTNEVVAQLKAGGFEDLYYAYFDEFPGGYVADGHPTVATHRKMAEELIESIDKTGVFGNKN